MEVTIVGRSDGYELSKELPGATWAVSSVFKLLEPRGVDLIFNLHKPELWEPWLIEEAHRTMTAFPRIVVSGTGCQFLQFPVEAMLKKYGPVFGSSIAWMIAFAIEQGAKKINIVGVDLATREEYVDQRDTFFYMVGRAEAAGVEVIIPTTSRTFFKDRIYGVM
jgi:hypothetical protein